MRNECRKICNIYNVVITILLIWITLISICDIISNDKLNKLNKRLDAIEQIKQDSSLIIVNGELIDEDDYNQMDWQSYTPAKDSIE